MQKIAAILCLEGPVFDGLARKRLEFDVTVHRNAGLVVKEDGNRCLIIFMRAKTAITCAIELRRLDEISSRKLGTPALLRSAISLGPVNIGEDSVEGDAVEIASNLITIIEPGDILITRSCRNAVADKLPIDFEPLNEGSSSAFNVVVDANQVLSAMRHENPVAPDWSWQITLPTLGILFVIGLGWSWFNMPD